MTNTIKINRPLVCISALSGGKSSGIEPVYKENYMRTVRKVFDIQDELYALLGGSSHNLAKQSIHERQWDKAGDHIVDEIERHQKKIDNLQYALRVINRIKR